MTYVHIFIDVCMMYVCIYIYAMNTFLLLSYPFLSSLESYDSSRGSDHTEYGKGALAC